MLAGVLTDPWGTRIEILKDDDLVGFHHVHIKSPDPKGTAEWYSKVLGVEVGRYKGLTQIYALRLSNMYFWVQRSIRPLEPAADRSVYHIGIKVDDFDAKVKMLEAMGAKFLKPAHRSGDHMYANVEGPDGVEIVLID